MLKITGLEKTFYPRRTQLKVVDGVSLDVNSGEVFGFLGPNGAGKTTTVKMIVGLLFPDKGKIEIANHPSTSSAAQQITGFMPETPQFYLYLKAREVLQLAGELFNRPIEQLRKDVPRILEQVGLSEAAERNVGRFSKGMHQRLAFAITLINDPQLLIFDEPLDGLDPLGRQDFKKLILDLKKRGKTVFFSSHILADVEELCDQVAILNQGKILCQGQPRHLTGGKMSLEDFFVQQIREEK